MPKKLEKPELVRDWTVLVRFRKGGKAVILEAMRNWRPTNGEKKTISSFIRHVVWQACKPPEDKSAG